MDPATELNLALERHHKAALHTMSGAGRRMFFPRGIPRQAAEAKGARINATIGEITDGHGNPLPLPAMSELVTGMDPRWAFLYAPQGGHKELRQAWKARIDSRGVTQTTLPVVTNGLSQGLSLLAELFCDEETDVLLPEPMWGNYRLLFDTLRGGRVRTYTLFEGERFTVEPLRQALLGQQRKGVLVLNFPGNPTGYTPTAAEAQALVEVIRAHQGGPLLIACDDAYQDMLFEPGLMPRSLFYELADLDPDRFVVAKVDGATKELLFFGGRVGFLTIATPPEAAPILDEKLRGGLRATISTASGPAQAMTYAALQDPNLEAQRRSTLDILAQRYRLLKDALAAHEVPAWPFNSGCFALVPVQGDAEAIRKAMLHDDSIGVVSIPSVNAIRLAYCSLAPEDIEPVVVGLRRHLR